MGSVFDWHPAGIGAFKVNALRDKMVIGKLEAAGLGRLSLILISTNLAILQWLPRNVP